MKLYLIIVFLTVIALSCSIKEKISTEKGYIVYFLPNQIRFVSTKNIPDSNYVKHFTNSNFKSGFVFISNCIIDEKLNSIKADTLTDENQLVANHASFLKKPLVFPAEIKFIDTATKNFNRDGKLKFKMVYKGANVEFDYSQFKGIVLDLKRID